MKTYFITGASGLLGSNIIQMTQDKSKVFGNFFSKKVFFKNSKILKIDLSDKKQVKSVEEINPDLIIHCAALTNVDACEKNPEAAYKHNVVSTENIIRIAEKLGCFFIYISTDAVFDGKKGNYSEKDSPKPVNIYGKTKLEAEKIVQKTNIDSCIVRTNIYGWNKLDKFSLAEWMIDKFEKNESFGGFFDVLISPILVNNFTDALVEIFKKRITGILNVSGSECTSKYNFSQMVAEVFDYNKNLVKKISVDNLNLPATRGKNLCLNISKAKLLLDTKLLNIKDSLAEMKRLKNSGFLKDLKS